MSETKDLIPSDDTYSDSNEPDHVKGSATQLTFENSTIDRAIFLKWDFSPIPPGAKIISAICYLYVASVGGTTIIAGLTERCDADWNEGELTYNNRPNVTGSSIHSWAFPEIGWYNCGGDFTDIVQNWINKSVNNYGVRIWQEAAFSYGYCRSKEYASNKPYLRVVYTLSGAPFLLNFI
ncbi:hypothetical protein ES707_10669 [subsurface metagenome]